MMFPPPQQFGGYQLMELIGKGGMGSVYKAQQQSNGRVVAVKILPTDLSHEVGYVKRFKREARIAASLQHSHILPIYDFGMDGDTMYIVMPFMSGGSLSDYLKQNSGTPSSDKTCLILNILDQLTQALDFAHNKGIVHRDLTPANILFDEARNCYLTDFGIAKDLATQTSQTVAGTQLGTPAYMSPEQWEGRRIDQRTDLYALGIITHELLTGELPFVKKSRDAMMYAHLNTPVDDCPIMKSNQPEIIKQFFRRALAKSHADRFDSALKFMNAAKKAIMESDSCLETSHWRTSGTRASLIYGLLGLILGVMLTVVIFTLVGNFRDNSGNSSAIANATPSLTATGTVNCSTAQLDRPNGTQPYAVSRTFKISWTSATACPMVVQIFQHSRPRPVVDLPNTASGSVDLSDPTLETGIETEVKIWYAGFTTPIDSMWVIVR